MAKLSQLKPWIVLTALALLSLVVAGCAVGAPAPAPAPALSPQPEAPAAPSSETITLYVGPNRIPCTGVAPQLCYQVKESPEAEYTLFYGTIEGFEYEPGYEYQLTVQKEKVENPPADASAFKWTLVEVVSKTPVAPAAELEGTLWGLIALTDDQGQLRMPTPGADVTATFQDGRVTGNAGCNNYFGGYTVDGQNLTIQPGGTTMMACPEPIMTQEAFFLANLQSAASYVVVGNQLQISDANGSIILAFSPVKSQPLTGVTWQAISYNNGREAVVSLLNGSEITALFDEEGNLSGSAGCNNYSAGYQVDGNNITISPAAATMMFCAEPEGVMEQETAYLAALTTAATYSVQGDQLELRTADGALVANYVVKAAAAEAPAIDEAALQALGNLAYQGTSVFTGTVQLVNGVYTATVAPDSATVATVQMTDYVAQGELNGQPAYAVVLASNGGGSGVFIDLAIVVEQDGQWTNVATTYLGDRVQINSVAIENNQVVVDMVTQGPDDPMCCPTQQVIQTYALQDGELTPTSTVVIAAAVEMPGETVTATAQLEAEGIDGLTPDLITLDTQGLAESYQWQVVPATPYDASMPPGPTGAPTHLLLTFDGEDVNSPDFSGRVLRIYPIAAYEELWNAAGDPTISNSVEQLDALMRETPPAPESIPVLPPPSGVDDLTTQVEYLVAPGADAGGVRWVGRFVQDASPVLNWQLRYLFQGMTNDGKFYISAIYPVTTTLAPDDVDDMTEEQQQQAEADFDAYMQATKDALNAAQAADFSPDLSRLDAMIESLAVGKPAQVSTDGASAGQETAEAGAVSAADIVGVTWNWVGFTDPVNGALDIPNPGNYTLELAPGSMAKVRADCNRGGGSYTVDGSSIQINITTLTRAMCPPDSLGDQFVQNLNAARIFFMQDGNLFFDLFADSGTMEFAKGD